MAHMSLMTPARVNGIAAALQYINRVHPDQSIVIVTDLRDRYVPSKAIATAIKRTYAPPARPRTDRIYLAVYLVAPLECIKPMPHMVDLLMTWGQSYTIYAYIEEPTPSLIGRAIKHIRFVSFVDASDVYNPLPLPAITSPAHALTQVGVHDPGRCRLCILPATFGHHCYYHSTVD